MLFPNAGVDAEKSYREMKERDERDREVVRAKATQRLLANGINPITGLSLRKSPYNA